jgi:hypothetical protein
MKSFSCKRFHCREPSYAILTIFVNQKLYFALNRTRMRLAVKRFASLRLRRRCPEQFICFLRLIVCTASKLASALSFLSPLSPQHSVFDPIEKFSALLGRQRTCPPVFRVHVVFRGPCDAMIASIPPPSNEVPPPIPPIRHLETLGSQVAQLCSPFPPVSCNLAFLLCPELKPSCRRVPSHRSQAFAPLSFPVALGGHPATDLSRIRRIPAREIRHGNRISAQQVGRSAPKVNRPVRRNCPLP